MAGASGGVWKVLEFWEGAGLGQWGGGTHKAEVVANPQAFQEAAKPSLREGGVQMRKLEA